MAIAVGGSADDSGFVEARGWFASAPCDGAERAGGGVDAPVLLSLAGARARLHQLVHIGDGEAGGAAASLFAAVCAGDGAGDGGGGGGGDALSLGAGASMSGFKGPDL